MTNYMLFVLHWHHEIFQCVIHVTTHQNILDGMGYDSVSIYTHDMMKFFREIGSRLRHAWNVKEVLHKIYNMAQKGYLSE